MLPFAIGAVIVAALWASNKGPTVTPSAPTSPTSDTNRGDMAQNPYNTTTVADPTGQQPADVSTTTVSETGAVDTTTDVPSQPSGASTSPPPAPVAMTAPGPQTVPTQPASPASYVTASYQVAYNAQYGQASTKTDQSNYYQQQQQNGTVVL